MKTGKKTREEKMKYLVISLLSVSLLFAADYIDGELLVNSEQVESTTYSIETMSDEVPFALNYLTPVERAVSQMGEDPSAMPDFDWSWDIEIYPGRVGSSQDFDIDEDTGDIYAIFDTDHDGATINDSATVYRSQDGGVTWSYWRTSYSSASETNNAKIRVMKDTGGQTWVCMMFLIDTDLWVRRMTPDQSSSFWETVTTNAVEYADMDADIGTGAWVYVTYVIDGTTTVRVARNANGGAGFVDDANIYTNAGIWDTHPAVAAAVGGNASVAFTRETATVPEIRVKRTTNYGSSWNASELVEPAGGWDDIYDIDIAYSRGATQVGWITITFEFSTSDNFGYFLSTDSGLSWAWEALFSTGEEENLGSIRARKVNGDVTVAYNVDPGDSTMFTWTSPGNPTNFTTPIRINEFAATGYWPAAAGWNGNYSAILYTNWDINYRLMFDWFGNTGIEGTSVGLDMIQNAPNPFNATTNISFSLAQSSPVTISIYNIAGQLVSTLADNQSFEAGTHSVQWNAQSFTPGVYFCRLNADGISQTHRMLMVR